MSHFDELPRRDRSHEIEDEALAAFAARLTESGCFILQAAVIGKTLLREALIFPQFL